MPKRSAPQSQPAAAEVTPAFERLVALQQGNVETLLQLQRLLLEAVEAGWQLYLDRSRAWHGRMAAAMAAGLDLRTDPGIHAAEMRTALDRALTDAETTIRTGVRAQARAGRLLAERIDANIAGLEALAA